MSFCNERNQGSLERQSILGWGQGIWKMHLGQLVVSEGEEVLVGVRRRCFRTVPPWWAGYFKPKTIKAQWIQKSFYLPFPAWQDSGREAQHIHHSTCELSVVDSEALSKSLSPRSPFESRCGPVRICLLNQCLLFLFYLWVAYLLLLSPKWYIYI